MKETKKYKYFTIAVVIFCIYILATEVVDRWVATFKNYDILAEREKVVLTPEELINKKMDLVAKKRMLTAQLTQGKGSYEQNQIGIVKLINTCAKESNALLRSLTPLGTKTLGQIVEHNFKLEVAGTYHGIAKFVNALEAGVIPVKITGLDVILQKSTSQVLLATIEGKAFVLSKESAK